MDWMRELPMPHRWQSVDLFHPTEVHTLLMGQFSSSQEENHLLKERMDSPTPSLSNYNGHSLWSLARAFLSWRFFFQLFIVEYYLTSGFLVNFSNNTSFYKPMGKLPRFYVCAMGKRYFFLTKKKKKNVDYKETQAEFTYFL